MMSARTCVFRQAQHTHQCKRDRVLLLFTNAYTGNKNVGDGKTHKYASLISMYEASAPFGRKESTGTQPDRQPLSHLTQSNQ